MSDKTGCEPRSIRPGGGYRKLRSFQIATLIYDGTVFFCDRWISKTSRTHDQMVQAARSGRQNIAEGSRASSVSSQSELRLTNVARASLDELLLDYEDFLRQRRLSCWSKHSPETHEIRALAKSHQQETDFSDPFGPYEPWIRQDDPGVVANTLICLIHQANYLLDRQLAFLEQDFIQQGGYKENLAAARIAERDRQVSQPAPSCPECGKKMVWRIARRGARAGLPFWGCNRWPVCKGTRPIEVGE
ncbi:MAG: four helix bundle protein [Candidatus Hydrogenedens sp.]|jgi:four helix bundle suffix protein|nr:four helix bundle protein [Candidatus Hydrogenedens sp.]